MKNRFLRSFDFRFGRVSLLKPSVLALLLANLFPVVGVICLGWDVFLLLVLFWTENVVIGFYTVLKMLLISRDKASWAAKFPFIAFFCVHYGLFTLAHGFFVFALFGGYIMDGSASLDEFLTWQKVTELGWGGLALLISHGVSLFYNYLGKGEYKRTSLKDVMEQPYGRVVILHLTIIFGGFLMALLGSPVVGLLFLIVLKTAIDIRAHLREHAKYTARKQVTA